MLHGVQWRPIPTSHASVAVPMDVEGSGTPLCQALAGLEPSSVDCTLDDHESKPKAVRLIPRLELYWSKRETAMSAAIIQVNRVNAGATSVCHTTPEPRIATCSSTSRWGAQT